MDNQRTVKRFDGHVQTIIKREEVEFIFGDGHGLLSVCYDRFSFGILPDNTLETPGGYPLSDCVLGSIMSNVLMELARQICQEALKIYLCSPEFYQDKDFHEEQWVRRPYSLHDWGKDLANRMQDN